jgi:hypothetical protein
MSGGTDFQNARIRGLSAFKALAFNVVMQSFLVQKNFNRIQTLSQSISYQNGKIVAVIEQINFEVGTAVQAGFKLFSLWNDL